MLRYGIATILQVCIEHITERVYWCPPRNVTLWNGDNITNVLRTYLIWKVFIGVHLVAGAAEEQFLVFVHVCNLKFSSTFVAFEAILGDTQKMRNNDKKKSPNRVTS